MSNPTPAPVVVNNPAAGVVNNAPPTVVIQPPVPAPAPMPAIVPLVDQNLVASIVFTKNSAGQTMPIGENADYGGWRTFQIGELKAYDAVGRLLTSSDYSSVVYNNGGFGFPGSNLIDGDPKTFTHTSGLDPIHQMTVTLKTPVNISKVQVLNRADCCQARLNGTVCEFKRSNGTVIKQFVLTSDMVQNLSL